MGPLIAFVLVSQIPVADVEAIVSKAVPEATWSTAPADNGALLFTARTVEQVSSGIQAAQGPARVTPEAELPPIVTNDQLMLIPDGSSAKPAWKKVETAYAVMDVDLGAGHGYHWYSHGTYRFSSAIRRAAKLQGGDDPLKVAIQTLSKKDRGEMTRNTGYYDLVEARDKAVPYLRAEIGRSDKYTKYTAIYILGQIRTPKAGDELLRLYKTGDKLVGNAVGDAAAYRPYLSKLKPVYRELLQHGRVKLAPAEAARQFGWRDFLPDLRKAYAKAEGPMEAMAVYEAIDFFTARRIDENVRAATRVGVGVRPANSDRLLAKFPDPTYRTLAAFRMIGYATKGGAPFVDEGRALLGTVPAAVKGPLVKRFNMGWQVEHMRQR